MRSMLKIVVSDLVNTYEDLIDLNFLLKKIKLQISKSPIAWYIEELIQKRDVLLELKFICDATKSFDDKHNIKIFKNYYY